MTVEPGSSRVSSWLLALLVLLGVDCAFLSPALFTPAVRAPADITPHYPPFLAERPDPPKPRNSLLQDWITQFHPWHHLVRDAWSAGRPPLWNDKSGCGEPLLANGQCEATSPYVPILMLAGDQYADWRQLAQLAVAQAFCLLLAAHLGLSAAAGMVVALTYSFSSYMQIWAVHPHAASASFAPAILWALLRLGSAPSAFRFLIAALCVAFSVLAGHVETAAKAGAAAGLIAVATAVFRKPAPGRLAYVGLVVLAGAAGLALAGCQLLPLVDYLDQSAVSDLRQGLVASDPGLPVSQLVTLLDPDALGSVVDGPPWRGAGSYAEAVLHVGVVGIALAAIGAVLGAFRRPAVVVPCLVTAAAGVVIACGLLRRWWTSIPGFGEIWPARFLYLTILPLALLAGVGFDEAARRLRGLAGPVARRVVACLVVLATAATAALPWREFIPASHAATLHPRARSLEALRARGASGRAIELGRIVPPGVGELWGYRRLLRYDAIGLERLTAMLRPEELRFPVVTHELMTFAPPNLLDALSVRWVLSMYPAREARAPVGPVVAPPGGSEGFDVSAWPRTGEALDFVFFRVTGAHCRDGTVEVVLSRAGGDVVWSLGPQGWTAAGSELLETKVPSAVGEFVATQVAGFHPEAFSIPHRLWQDASRVTFRVRAGSDAVWAAALLPDGIGADVVPREDFGWMKISERTSAMPDAYLAEAVVPAGDAAGAAKAVRTAGFDPHRQTVVEQLTSSEATDPSPLQPEERATVRRRSPGRIEVGVQAAAARRLVVTEAFARGWLAEVDGVETEVRPANLVSMSCRVPAGSHVVVFRYRPPAFVWGCVTSGATLLLLLAASIAGALRRRRVVGQSGAPTNPGPPQRGSSRRSAGLWPA